MENITFYCSKGDHGSCADATCCCGCHATDDRPVSAGRVATIWRYHDGRKWCYVKRVTLVPVPWSAEASQVRARIIVEDGEDILECEVL